jgi:hypothetical protein
MIHLVFFISSENGNLKGGKVTAIACRKERNGGT